MKKLILFIFMMIFLTGCFKSDEKKNEILTQEIKTQVSKDVGYLSNLEVLYGIDFTNKSKNWKNLIGLEDFYVRIDDASVFYGYPIEKIKMHVSSDMNGNRVLNVSLPAPERISFDRQISDLKTKNKNYVPKDEENGDILDVEKEMTKRLDKILDSYEPKMLELSAKVTEEYFEMLATNYGMKLELQFEKK
ncbi:hypothetical protein [Campylobacter ureolyticus]|uniref:hypothetical protein n=1 Tax=Campylobacter ureolyticus TaxID=827 RepID=UPI002889A1CD|nr:hypothetical protein [Campylobacter ureolyticus]